MYDVLDMTHCNDSQLTIKHLAQPFLSSIYQMLLQEPKKHFSTWGLSHNYRYPNFSNLTICARLLLTVTGRT